MPPPPDEPRSLLFERSEQPGRRPLAAWLFVFLYALLIGASAALVLALGWNVTVLSPLVAVCLWAPFVYPRPVSYSLLAIFVSAAVGATLLSPQALRTPPVTVAAGILLIVLVIELVYRMLAQRRRLEMRLADALARQQVLFDQASDGILLESMDGRVVDANARACELFGYNREEMLALSVSDLVPPDHHHRIASTEEALSQPFESINVRKDGRRFPVEITGSRVVLDGEPYWLVIVRDISQRQQLATMLELQNRLTLEISSATSLESAGTRLLGAARSLPGVEAGALFLFEEDGNRFRLLEAQGLDDGAFAEAMAFIPAASPFGKIVGLGMPQYFRPEDRFPDPLEGQRRELGLAAAGIIPVFFQTRNVAAILVASRLADDLAPLTCAALETIAYVAGTALARLQVERRLRTSEARFRNTFESATIGLFQTTVEGRVLSANDALAHMLRFESVAALLAAYGDDVQRAYTEPATRQLLLEQIQSGDRTARLETRFNCADGAQIDVLIGIWSVPDERDGVAYLEGFVEDITDRRNLLRRMELLHTIDRVLLSADALDERLPEILQQVHPISPFDRVELWSSTRGEAVEEYMHMVFEQTPQGLLLQRVGREAVTTLFPLRPEEHVHLIDDLRTLPEPSARVADWLAAGYRACLSARMQLQDKLYGRFTLLAYEPEAFSEVDSAFVDQLAHMFALGLQDRRLRYSEKRARQQAEDRARRIDLLRRSAVAINESFYVRDVLECGLANMMEAASSSAGWVVLEAAKSGNLEVACLLGLEPAEHLPCLTCLGLPPRCQGEPVQVLGAAGLTRKLACASLAGQMKAAADLELQEQLLLVPLHNGDRQMGAVKMLIPPQVQPDPELEQVLAAVASQISAGLDRVGLFERVNEMAIHDSLTGLYNRRYFFERAEYEFKRARRYGNNLSLLMLDLDFFKRVNDRYGHPAGDQVLQQVSQTLLRALRATDLLARYGGEEFIIMLAEADRRAAEVAANRLLQLLRRSHFQVPAGSLQLTISIGVTTLDDGVPDISALIDRADRALYQAKAGGRDTLVVL